MMVFCNVLIMAILLFTSLLSSSRLRCIQTLIIDVLSNDPQSNGCGWDRLLHDSTFGDTCVVAWAPRFWFFVRHDQPLHFNYNALVYFLCVLRYLKSDLGSKF